VVVDAGCRWGATTAWAALQPGLRVYAFDADADECARLGALQQPDDPVRYVPTALAAHRGEAELKIAREPACSSFFPPDPLAMRERPELGVIETVGTARVPADRLDLWAADAGVPHIEAMKLDVQGAELLVLEGPATCWTGCGPSRPRSASPPSTRPGPVRRCRCVPAGPRVRPVAPRSLGALRTRPHRRHGSGPHLVVL